MATGVSADIGSRFTSICSSGVVSVLVLGARVALLSVLADVAAVTVVVGVVILFDFELF